MGGEEEGADGWRVGVGNDEEEYLGGKEVHCGRAVEALRAMEEMVSGRRVGRKVEIGRDENRDG